MILIDSIDILPATVEQGVPETVINTLKAGNILFDDANGNSIDMTHIWALINALNSPKIDDTVDDLSGISIPDAISWVGDIGSVVAEFGLKSIPQYHSLPEYFTGLAGNADLYGDIDGYGVYFQSVDGSLKLSARIKQYYQQNYRQRFQYFSDATGIQLEKSTHGFAISDHSLNQIVKPHVKKFTFFWTLHLCKINKLECAAEEIEGKIYNHKDINDTIGLYSQWLDEQLIKT